MSTTPTGTALGRDVARAWLAAAPLAELAQRSVVVLAGGTSGEREVSLASGRGALAALRAAAARGIGPRVTLEVEIDAAGRWRVGGRALDPAPALAELPDDALFFLALHGGDGENGVVQGFLEHAGRAYTGSGVAASALCMEKQATRARLCEAGLAVAPGLVVDAREAAHGAHAFVARAAAFGARGWFVKPLSGGSSIATRAVAAGDETGLVDAVREAIATGDRALVEARIEGVEATCAVLGAADDARADALHALPPVEIVPHAGRFFDYAEKYSAGGADERCPALLLPPATTSRLEALALAAHRALGCDGASRTDFIVPYARAAADGSAVPGAFGEPVALEVNTLPGLTERSLLPRAAAAAGLDYGELCLALCLMGLAARRRRAARIAKGT